MCCPGCNYNALSSWNKATWMRTAGAATSLAANLTQGICRVSPFILVKNFGCYKLGYYRPKKRAHTTSKTRAAQTFVWPKRESSFDYTEINLNVYKCAEKGKSALRENCPELLQM